MAARPDNRPTPGRGTAEQYRKLLRGEITSQQYVKVVREAVRGGRLAARARGRRGAGGAAA